MNVISKYKNYIIYGMIFAGLMVFFLAIHPIVIFDTDDWQYIYYSRKAYPIFGLWNPARVMPELLMPLSSELSTWIIYPFTGDFIKSLSIMYAIILCLVIIVYITSLRKLLITRGTDDYTAIWCMLVFLLLHFLVFRTKASENEYLFSAHNATNIFYYTIPTILNYILAINMEVHRLECQNDIMTIWNKSLYAVMIYCAIFSNLFSSIVLASYVALTLLCEPFRKQEYRIGKKKCIVYLGIIILWGISCVFEMFGERAQQIGNYNQVWSSVSNTMNAFRSRFLDMNKAFLLLTCGTVAVFVILIFVDKTIKKAIREPLFMIACSIITLAFLILLCSVTGSSRISRSAVLLSIYGYLLISGMLLCNSIIEKLNPVKLLLPLFVLVIVFEINTGERTFVETNLLHLSPKVCAAIDDDIIGQIIEADRIGLDEIELHVIKTNTEDNWPHAIYGGQRFADALYKHGLITRRINIRLYPDIEMSNKYLMDY